MKTLYILFLFMFSIAVSAETILNGDVTAELGPNFFLDGAATGGSDFSSGDANFSLEFSNMGVGSDGSDVVISGVGWASKANVTNYATQATVTITYLGADGVFGGADDVVIGSRTDAVTYSGSGEYYWRFDTPLTAVIDGSTSMFRINISADGTGLIYYKTSGDVKLSVAGTASAIDAINLALYRDLTASSKQDFARYATDGVVGDDFKWLSEIPTTTSPSTLDMAFPGPIEIGSYHIYSGANTAQYLRYWQLQYRLNGSAWADVPGASVTVNNFDAERNIIFPAIIVDELRLLMTANWGGVPKIREWAVFPPNGGNGYPLGTGVTLNMAKDGLTTADSNAPGQYPRLATDGYLGTRWVSGSTGPHTNEVTLRDEIKIGSAHLYSGDGTPGSAIADFNLEYYDGSTWRDVPGGTVAGNTNTERVINFSSVITAEIVRLVTTDVGPVAVRELVVFPDNAGAGYPIYTDVKLGGPPPMNYETYSDSYYHLRSESANQVLTGGTTLTASNHLDKTQTYQLLLNVGTDTYRIFNRGTRKCLAIKDASLAAGAEIIEEPYGAFPSQRWRISAAGGGSVYIENALSRMRLEVSGSTVLQMPRNAIAAQKWNIDFLRGYPKKGAAAAGALAVYADDMDASWHYGWSANYNTNLNENVVDANLMQWGKGNLDPDDYATGQLPLTVRFPDWNSRGNPMVFLGFNEPDKTDQSNITVDRALEIWPQLMASGQPLASPVTAGWTKTWMTDWMTEAANRGYQLDYLAMHTYPGPDAANIVVNVGDYSAAYNDRPVFITEFGFVDWDDSKTWTENLLYNQMLELLWRLEESTVCKRYSLFGFKEEAAKPEYDQPTDPTGRARRSNWQYLDGSFTPLGEAYMGWDGDTTPNGDQPYILHNRSFDMRVRNDGTTAVDAVNIRTSDASAQAVFESIGNGYYYIVSSLDGKRLRKTSATTVAWAPSNTTTTDAQWSWSLVEAGWHLVSNRAGGNLRYSDIDGVHMGTASGSYYHWFFVPPMNPVDTIDPAPPTGLSATPAFKQVDLQWTGSISEDTVSYSVKRSEFSGGPYQLIASNLFASAFSDIGLTNGTTYYYVVDAIDEFGNTGTSAQASATPAAPDPDSYANWSLVAFDGAPGGTDTSESGNPDNDAYLNFWEYVFLLNPLVEDGMSLYIDAEAGGSILLSFQMNRHATGITWDLQSTTNLVVPGAWSTNGFSIHSQTNIGDYVEYVIQPDAPLPDSAFYRIDATMD